jgi:NAD(P)-dependent dehydrogenase (short-subunit alcohol dehydrogenase family)
VLALELGRQGYAIGLHYHSSAVQAGETADEIRKLGVPVFTIPADLSDPLQVDRLFDELTVLPHPLKILVNSAAVMQRHNLLDISAVEWDATLALNLRAPLLCAQHAARMMREAGGLIVNITDAGAARAWTGFPAYIISKSALENLTRLLARSLAPEIRVNSIAPGLISPQGKSVSTEWTRLVRRLPIQRSGTAEEMAGALAFLIHNEYVTGQSIVVDGGYQLI